MALPYLVEMNFEQGTNGEWDSESDTGSLLNFPHYTKLARYDTTSVGAIAPWRGAFCAEWDLGDTNDHTLIEGDMDIADTTSGFTRFYLFLGKDLRATADDIFSIFELQGTANVQESIIALKITAATGAVQMATAQAAADLVFTNAPILPRGKWICVELATAIVVGTATGTSQLFVDGTAYLGQITHAAVNTPVLRGVLGTQDTLSTTLGHIFMDAFMFDAGAGSARIMPNSDRYPETILITKTQHICLGNSELLNVTLLPTNAATNSLKIYDTDNANVTDDSNLVAWLYNLAAKEPPIDLADVPVNVKRGAYVVLAVDTAGTDADPQALIHIGRSQGYGSHGRVRQHGFNKGPSSGQVTQ